MTQRIGKALAYAIVIWIIGFVWGSIVFMTPSLKSVRPIPYISNNPAISFPILIVWLPVTYLLAKNYLKASSERSMEGLKLGLAFSLVNLILDLVILVLLLKGGLRLFYFSDSLVRILAAFDRSLADGPFHANKLEM